jgi:hypothetical protein
LLRGDDLRLLVAANQVRQADEIVCCGYLQLRDSGLGFNTVGVTEVAPLDLKPSSVRATRGTAEPVPFVHQRNSKTCRHLDSSRSTEPNRFCSAKLSSKQSTSYIVKKQVVP